MASYNKVLLMGNLTRDPQLKYLPSQMAVVEFSIACNRKFRTATGEDREEVTFVEMSAFGKTGEVINQYFTKGKPIFIEGRLKLDQWEDKNGGGKRSKMTVVVEISNLSADEMAAAEEAVVVADTMAQAMMAAKADHSDRHLRERHSSRPDHPRSDRLRNHNSPRRNNPSAMNSSFRKTIFRFKKPFVVSRPLSVVKTLTTGD